MAFGSRAGVRVGGGAPLLGLVTLAALLWGVAAPSASAHNAYVANFGSADVTVIDTTSNEPLGEPIEVGDGPGGIAITPDGTRAYIANFGSDDVSVIDTASNETVGEPIEVGNGPRGVAITPNGKRVYVANEGSESVSVIDAASNEAIDEITVGSLPLGIAITPDGTRAYVANEGSDSVSVIDTATNTTLGLPITVGTDPLAIAITPDGKRAYVTNFSSDDVSVIDTATASVIDTITFSSFLIGVAITPDGGRAYVANWSPGTVSAIDTASNTLVGEPISAGTHPFGIAITPDGTHAYITNDTELGTVSMIDTASNEAVGEPISAGTYPFGIAIVPDQPPLAALAATSVMFGQPVQFDASASHDPDGQIARYDWDFGDGQTASDAGPKPTHTYSAPGVYQATVTVTDSEGCSTTFVFTGLTASCNGSSAARAARAVQVASPPPPPPTTQPSNVFQIHKLRRNRRRGIAGLRVWVPGPGALLMRGRRVRAVKRKVGRARGLTLVVRPKRRVMKALKRHGNVWVRVRITYRPFGGTPRTRARKLRLVRTGGRPHRR